MSEPDASNERSLRRFGLGKLFLAVLLLVGVLAIAWLTRIINDESNGGSKAKTEKRLELTRSALAATENLETAQADRYWSSLFRMDPQDSSVAWNRAINRVLRVEQLSARATNASLETAEKKAARSQLPDAIAEARLAMDESDAVANDAVTAIWLRANVDLREASLLPGTMTRSVHKQIYSQLADAVTGEPGTRPQGRILGGAAIQVIDQMEDPIDGLPDELQENAAETVGVLSERFPDNLFFALRAARMNIAAKKTQAVDFVQRASDLSAAIKPWMRRETQAIGVTPDELVAQIEDAIHDGQWLEAENRISLWFNVLNSSEIVKTDRRRSTPHPLDLLSFDLLRRLSAEVVASSPLDRGSEAIDSSRWGSRRPATSDRFWPSILILI